MIYKFTLLQIIVYLFISPFLRLHFTNSPPNYYFLISFYFLTFFMIGSIIKIKIDNNDKNSKISKISKISKNYFTIKNNIKYYLIIILLSFSIYISYKYSLYDRRLGTEAVAELFSEIELWHLLIFRYCEIIIPYLTSIILLILHGNYNFKKNAVILIVLVFFTFLMLGAISSRSAIGIFLLTILIINQNKFKPSTLKHLCKIIIAIAFSIFTIITAYRFTTNLNEDRSVNEYFSAEFLQRVDGLEVVSNLIDLYDVSVFGINPSAVINPILASLSFLEASTALKASAMTTVKSIILTQEFNSSYRDINTFIILDGYYFSGLFGIALFAMLLASITKLVDAKIGREKNITTSILLISLATNLIILEREIIGIAINIIRDFIILYSFSFLFLNKSNEKT